MKTRVFITVDVECAEERFVDDRTQPPMDVDLRVFGRLSNQRHELGIGLFMNELETFGLAATFFVDVLGPPNFGQHGLAEICTLIRAREHDLQLHLHPILREPRWRSQGGTPPNDDKRKIPISYKAILGGRTDMNIVLIAGDEVYVP